MDGLISMVAQRSGISENKAKTAVDTVVGFLKEHAPAGLSAARKSRKNEDRTGGLGPDGPTGEGDGGIW